MFQSLIHQVSVSFRAKRDIILNQNTKFQSLIHQVSVSFLSSIMEEKSAGKVSIPYSSGQCFFLYSDNSCKIMIERFQSLIHQVSVSFQKF